MRRARLVASWIVCLLPAIACGLGTDRQDSPPSPPPAPGTEPESASAEPSGLDDPQAQPGDGAEQQQKAEVGGERRIRGTVQQGEPADESGSGIFDSQLVVRQIRARLRAMQRCYERELRDDPTLAGHVMVRFTIRPNGTVSGVRATENNTGSPAVASCAVNTIRRFRFNPGPEGGNVTFTFPFVFVPRD